MDRYQETINASRVTEDDAFVAREVERESRETASDYGRPEVYKFLFNSIDLTTLSSEDCERSVARFTTPRQ